MVEQIQNTEAEKLLLGAILKDPDVAKELTIEHKHISVMHRHIFEAITKIVAENEKVDLATISAYLPPGAMSQVDWRGIKDHVPSARSHETYQRLILESYKHNELKRMAQSFLEESSEHVSKESFESFINEVTQLNLTHHVQKDFDLQSVLLDIWNDAESGVVDQGILTGYSELDRMTNGIKKTELTIVAARPSVGKTAFAINISNALMSRDAFGHLYSLEMGEKKFVIRMLTAEGNIDSMKMRNPRDYFEASDWERLSYATAAINKQSMYIHEASNVKVAQIYANTKKLMRQHPDKEHFVVIDYLQLLTPTSNKVNRNEQISEISRALKNMAMDLNIPVIALSQLSRGVEQRQDKRPMLSDLRESGSIEQDADNVLFLYRDDYYDKESEKKDIIEIIIAKQREGPVGTVELAYIREYNKFVNLERRYAS
ncbi:replicative DNA helicase [Paenalkalicoccus suaedae]|uniref:Replicative DNA helicase n=1 Tax=Paenalkalicoccus suaedae TaxID=2592382 RepID=A0A859FCD8_9BACI|nr:replicative DNA helicase [Paenalkalicoccus suaedae]QKS70224.1 replicative DNA helicase [Paenalkalicoccus suaedae]